VRREVIRYGMTIAILNEEGTDDGEMGGCKITGGERRTEEWRTKNEGEWTLSGDELRWGRYRTQFDMIEEQSG